MPLTKNPLRICFLKTTLNFSVKIHTVAVNSSTVNEPCLKFLIFIGLRNYGVGSVRPQKVICNHRVTRNSAVVLAILTTKQS